jgi:hypothetical protein
VALDGPTGFVVLRIVAIWTHSGGRSSAVAGVVETVAGELPLALHQAWFHPAWCSVSSHHGERQWVVCHSGRSAHNDYARPADCGFAVAMLYRIASSARLALTAASVPGSACELAGCAGRGDTKPTWRNVLVGDEVRTK